ncbi:MAG: hypothetical protein KDD25_09175, partial [Bdellovibrionales bacterium]|nr:hypothetical protein [Bdellovibrionales bacterium]
MRWSRIPWVTLGLTVFTLWAHFFYFTDLDVTSDRLENIESKLNYKTALKKVFSEFCDLKMESAEHCGALALHFESEESKNQGEPIDRANGPEEKTENEEDEDRVGIWEALEEREKLSSVLSEFYREIQKPS